MDVIDQGFGTLSDPDTLLVLRGAAPAAKLFGIWGDSHAAGASDPSKGDSAFNVASTPGVSINGRYAAGSGVDPPSWTDFDVNMVMRSLAPHAFMGSEITIGRALKGATANPAIAVVAGNGYLLDTNWKPTATFMLASTGANLFNTTIARMQSFETSLGAVMSGLFLFVGANDAAAGGASTANYGTNLTALFAAVRAVWPALPIVLARVNVNEAVDPTNLATVRAAQASVVAGDAHAFLADGDELALIDGLHFGANGNLTLGDRMGYAMRALRGDPLPAPTTTPTVIGWGPAEFGSGTLSPTSFAGVRNGDLEVMIVMNGVTNGATIATPAGWTAVGSLTTTGATGLFVNFRIFTRQVTTAMLNANSGHTAPTSVVAGDTRNLAKIFAIRGPNLNPTINAFGLWAENDFQATKTIPGITTTVPNCGVLVLFGGWTGNIGRTQSVTNGALTNVVELQDGNDLQPATDSLMLAATAGEKPVAGATGSFSNTTTGGNVIGMAAVIAIAP